MDDVVSERTKGFATSGRDYLKIQIKDMKRSKWGNQEQISKIRVDKETLDYIVHSDLPDPKYDPNPFKIGTPGVRQTANKATCEIAQKHPELRYFLNKNAKRADVKYLLMIDGPDLNHKTSSEA